MISINNNSSIFQFVEQDKDKIKDPLTEKQRHENFKNAIKYFAGKFVTRRLFVQMARRSLKSITDTEFLKACQDLCPDYGRFEEVLLGRNSREHLYVIFYKHDPEAINKTNVTEEEYNKYKFYCERKIKYSRLNLNSCVFEYLKANNHVSSESQESTMIKWKS